MAINIRVAKKVDLSDPFYEFFKNEKLSLDDVTKRCEWCRKEALKGYSTQKTITQYNWNQLCRSYEICSRAVAGKQRYYSNTTMGKIANRIQNFMEKVFGIFGVRTSIHKAQEELDNTGKFIYNAMEKGQVENIELPFRIAANNNLFEGWPAARMHAAAAITDWFFPNDKETSIVTLFTDPLDSLGGSVDVVSMPQDTYVIQRVKSIGDGSGKYVYVAHSKHYGHVAVSMALPPSGGNQKYDSKKEERIVQENEMLQKLAGLGTTEAHACFKTPVIPLRGQSFNTTMAITPLYDCDLKSLRIDALDTRQKKHLIHSLLSAVQKFHQHAWVHRDMKLENALVKYNKYTDLYDVVLSDCESVCNVNLEEDKEKRNKVRGTAQYLAPEYTKQIYKDEKNMGAVTRLPIDIWGLGHMVYYIKNNKMIDALVLKLKPEQIKTFHKNLDTLSPGDKEDKINGIYIYCIEKLTSADLNVLFDSTDPEDQMIKKMFAIDPNQRATIDELVREWAQIHP